MADRPEMFGVFRDDRFNGAMQNVAGPTLVAMVMTGAVIQLPTGLFEWLPLFTSFFTIIYCGFRLC